jgi:hypothetical protein
MKLRDWTRRRSLLAVFGILLAIDLLAGIGSASLAIAASVKQDVGSGTSSGGSAKTVAWDDGTRNVTDANYGVFKALKVTVDQTSNLTDQGVHVSWTGGKVTPPQDDKTNYLQIMQCWGDPSAGPKPQQCEWGEASTSLSSLVGSNAANRSLVNGEDPLQDYGSGYQVPLAHNIKAWAVPFQAVDGTSAWNPLTYFSQSSSNEVTVARTGQDGSGSYEFETQTSLSAPELGCGTAITTGGVTAGRACWLVVVPRGEFNADGTPASSNSDGRVGGSPLSATNWADRIQFKLGFTAIGASCPLGRAERRTAGSELIAGAFTSWQSALCATGTTYGYSEIGDAEARAEAVSGAQGATGLGFVALPIDATAAAGATLEYAPVAESAIVVGYNIDKHLVTSAPDYADNGTPVTNLVLTPRLVAKLLTQSYQNDVPDGGGKSYLAANPTSLRTDPDFLALNPEFKFFPKGSSPDGLMVALGNTDAASAIWAWLRADPDASDFLNGKADPWGTVVNPSYLSLKLGTDTTVDSYPKADLSTFRQSTDIPAPGYGTLDMRPYTLDMDEAASRTLHADANVKTVWDQTKLPPAFTDPGAQVPGERFEISITVSNSADLYGLQTAKLVNAAGKAVAPTSASIGAGVDAMVPSATDGVVVTDPNKRVNAAYPLSMLTYAVVNVCNSSLPALADYRKLLNYIAGPGQVSGSSLGQLPDGYVPLKASLIGQVAAASKALASEIATPVCVSHIKVPKSANGGTTTTAPPAPADAPSATPTPTATPGASPSARMTPAVQTTATRYTVLAALFFAVPCLAIGPILLRRRRL